MPRGDALSLYRGRFACRKVDIRNIRGAVKITGLRISDGATMGAVFGMVSQVSHNHDAWEKKGEPTLKNALRLMGQETSCRNEALVGRIRNSCAPPPKIADGGPTKKEPAPAGAAPPVPDLDESLASNKATEGDSGAIPPRAEEGDGYAGEYAAYYGIIYGDELESGEYSAISNGANDDCEEIAAAGRQVNPQEAFRGAYSHSRQT